MRPPFCFDDAFEVPHPRAVVWRHALDVPAWQARWPWLALDAGGTEVAVGRPTALDIRSPLGWSFGVEVVPTNIERGERLEARVTGDLEGVATLRLTDAGESHTVAHLEGRFLLGGILEMLDRTVGRTPLEVAHRMVLQASHNQFLDDLEQASRVDAP